MDRSIYPVAIVLFAAACSSSSSPAPAPPPPLPTSTGAGSTTGGEAPAPLDVAGSWRSAACGERKYERRIELQKDGRFEAEDRVSPCPPGAQCVWSGIVIRRGTWKLEGGSIALTPEPPQGPQAGQPFPAALGIDPATSAPTEGSCVYQRPM